MTATLTSEQQRKIHNLKQAQFGIRAAIAYVNMALGESDVGRWYSKDLQDMIEEMEVDINDVRTPAIEA